MRIPVKPQIWLFALNLVVQAPMAALFFFMAFGEGVEGLWVRIFGGVMGLCCLGLFLFSALVLARNLGKKHEIVLEGETLSVPNGVKGTIDEVLLSRISSAQITETTTVAVSFWALGLQYKDASGKERALSIQSQLIGVPAFHALCDALRERGVRIG